MAKYIGITPFWHIRPRFQNRRADYRRWHRRTAWRQRSSIFRPIGRLKKLERELTALDKIGCGAVFAENLPLPIPVAGAVQIGHQAQFNPRKRSSLRHTSPFSTSMAAIISSCISIVPMYLDWRTVRISMECTWTRTKKGGGWPELEAFSQRCYPDAPIAYHWATQDCMSLDGIPYIGRYSAKTPNLYVATGFNKWGMTSAMAAASLLTDLVLGRDNPYTDLFSPSRSILRPQLAVNSLEAVVNLMTPTTPRCPHLGCALKYNPAEHSWDCPCHGSRFTSDGKLIDNPSTGDKFETE